MPSDDWSAREHILNRFEAAWAKGDFPDLQRFCNEVEPNVRDEELLVELCLIDLEHRLRNGQPARSEDYARIFGERWHSREIQKQLVSGEIAVRNYVGPPATSCYRDSQSSKRNLNYYSPRIRMTTTKANRRN